MKNPLFVLAAVSLLAAACNQVQPVNSVSSKNTNPGNVNKDSSSTANPGYNQSNKTPQSKFNTSTWNVYQDKHISFKYPKDWKVKIKKSDYISGSFTDLSLSDSKKEYQVADGPTWPPISIIYRPETSVGDHYLKDQREMIGKDGKSTLQDKTVLIGGKQAYVQYGSAVDAEGANVFLNERFLFRNGFLFNFSSYAHDLATYGNAIMPQQTQQIDDIFETVLSTVKFMK